MDNIEINEYIKNLDSDKPQYLQDFAISQLVHLEESQLHLLVRPITKWHWRNAAIVLKTIGYPRVKAIIPELLQWIQDMNWPGAEEIVDLLITIDDEIVPHVKQVLRSRDGIWIVWLLTEVASKWNKDLLGRIKEDLFELSITLDNNLVIEGVDIQAMKLLYENNSIDKEKLSSVIKRKTELYQELLENLHEFNESIDL
jgi:DNA-binding cell septation regulator SpoVG